MLSDHQSDLAGRRPAVPCEFVAFTAMLVLAVIAVTPALLRTGPWWMPASPAFWMLAALMLAGELLPIPVPRRNGLDKVTISSAFAFAMLLHFGPGAATLMYVASLVIADSVERVTPIKVLFNAAQYALAIVAAATVLEIGGRSAPVPLAGNQIPLFVASGMAFHDQLTELPNRAMLMDRLAAVIASSERDGSIVGVMIVDLDDFKTINDTLGHEFGDLVLQQLAPRLEAAVGPTGLLARLGGDEFAVVLHHVRRTRRWRAQSASSARSIGRCRSTHSRSRLPAASVSHAGRSTGAQSLTCSGTPTSRSTAPRARTTRSPSTRTSTTSTASTASRSPPSFAAASTVAS